MNFLLQYFTFYMVSIGFMVSKFFELDPDFLGSIFQDFKDPKFYVGSLKPDFRIDLCQIFSNFSICFLILLARG